MLKVLINPSKSERGSGITSFASWENPDTLFGIHKIFNINPNEKLKQIEITSEGITARIELLHGVGNDY